MTKLSSKWASAFMALALLTPCAAFAKENCERQVGDQMYYITDHGNGSCTVDVWQADEDGWFYVNTMTGACQNACGA